MLGLPAARAAIVVVVDGLGAAALKARSGHARTLAGALTKRSVISTGVPTTTAAALTTLMTGVQPGEHGIVSYSALEPASDRVLSQLAGWGRAMDPLLWQRRPTVFETADDIRSVAVGPAKYKSSGLTAAILRGAEYAPADGISERFDVALDAVRAGSALVYLYIPEADSAAHAEGWESDRWTAALEDVDSALTAALRRLPRDVALLVTADHGIVDVPEHRHLVVREDTGLLEGVRHVAGEPRLLHLHFEPELPEVERGRLVAAWRKHEEARAWIATRAEAVAAGWYGPEVADEVAPRIGDLLVAARGLWAYYDGRVPGAGVGGMIGQHGSWTPEETRVPLLRFGAAA